MIFNGEQEHDLGGAAAPPYLQWVVRCRRKAQISNAFGWFFDANKGFFNFFTGSAGQWKKIRVG